MQHNKVPHMWMSAIDPPREHPPRRWRCRYCNEEGYLDDLRKTSCTQVYPPCEICGQTPECAPECAGMEAVLGAPGVVVVGGEKPKLPEA